VKETKILQVPNVPYHFGTDFAGVGNLSDGHGQGGHDYHFGFGQNNDNWGGHWFWDHGFDAGNSQAPARAAVWAHGWAGALMTTIRTKPKPVR
jgi:hypothetical protein